MVEWLAGTPVIKLHFSGFRQIGPAQELLDILLGRSVEYRRGNLHPQHAGRPAQMCLHDLPDNHAVRHAQRIEDDINRCAIGQERHILYRQDARNDAFVTMTPRHLVAWANFALLSNAHAHELINAWRQFITCIAREYLDFDNLATLTVRDPQRGIFDFAGLLTENGA